MNKPSASEIINQELPEGVFDEGGHADLIIDEDELKAERKRRKGESKPYSVRENEISPEEMAEREAAEQAKDNDIAYERLKDVQPINLNEILGDSEVESLTDEQVVQLLHGTRQNYIKHLLKQTKRMGYGKFAEQRLSDAKEMYKSVVDVVIERDDLVYKLDQDIYGIKDDTEEYYAKLQFTGREREIIEEARIANLANTEFKKRVKDKIEWYQGLSRTRKIVYGVGAGALIGAGLGAVGAGAATGLAAAAGRTLKAYAANKKYREGPGVDEIGEQFIRDTYESDEDNRNMSEFSSKLLTSVDKDLKEDQKANRRTVGMTIGTVALGSAIGLGLRELLDIGEDAVHGADNNNEVPDTEIGNTTVIDTDVEYEPELTPEDLAWDAAKEAQEQAAEEANAEWDAVHTQPDTDGLSSEAQEWDKVHTGTEDAAETEAVATETTTQTVEFEDFTDTVDKGDGFSHVIRDLAKAEGYNDLKPGDYYELYKENEGAFASYLDTGEAYVMPNGDYGISSPGELTINAELREQLVSGMREKLGLPPLEDIQTEIGESLTIDADTEADIDTPDAEMDTNVDADTDISGAETETGGTEVAEPDAENGPESDIEEPETDSPAEAAPNAAEEAGETEEIEWADDVNEEMAEIEPGDNPWINARALAPASQANLLQQAVDSYAETNGFDAAEIKYPAVGSATVLFDGVEWNSTMWPEINEILISLAETR